MRAAKPVAASAALCSVEQASQETGLPASTIRMLIAQREIPVCRVPRSRRVFVVRAALTNKLKEWS